MLGNPDLTEADFWRAAFVMSNVLHITPKEFNGLACAKDDMIMPSEMPHDFVELVAKMVKHEWCYCGPEYEGIPYYANSAIIPSDLLVKAKELSVAPRYRKRMRAWMRPKTPNQRSSSMPLSKKGMKIRRAMRKQYGEKKGDEVFYASINKGKVKGAHKGKKK